MNRTELYHHGIKGMKWGQRRYQNKDGSLTSAGKKRQAKQTAKSDAHIKRMTQYNNEESVKKELAYWKGYYKKISDPKTGKKFAKDTHDEYDEASYAFEVDYARGKYISALADSRTVKKYFQDPVSKIDTSSISYKRAKELVNQYLNDYVNASLSVMNDLEKSDI